jgi:hypothetical protein
LRASISILRNFPMRARVIGKCLSSLKPSPLWFVVVPLAAPQQAKLPIVFVLASRANLPGLSLFQEGLAELAYVNGRNLLRADHMEYG